MSTNPLNSSTNQSQNKDRDMMIDEKSLGEVMSLADIEVAEPRK